MLLGCQPGILRCFHSHKSFCPTIFEFFNLIKDFRFSGKLFSQGPVWFFPIKKSLIIFDIMCKNIKWKVHLRLKSSVFKAVCGAYLQTSVNGHTFARVDLRIAARRHVADHWASRGGSSTLSQRNARLNEDIVPIAGLGRFVAANVLKIFG